MTITAQLAVPGSSGRTCPGVRGVVEHHQHLAVGQPAAEHRRPGLEVVRDPGPGHAERPEPVGEHVARCARVVRAGKVCVQLPVREDAAHAVCHPDRQRALADARLTAEHHQRRHPEHVGQLIDGLLPAGEVRNVRGKLANRPGRRGRGGRAGLTAQHLRVYVPQLRPRLDTGVLDQGCPGLAVDGERLGLAAGLLQRDHQLPDQPLAQRMLGHHRL